MRCRAVPCSCRAVQYSAGLCRAVPCACFVVLILSCMPGIVRSIIPGTGTPTGSYITNIVESQKIHSQLSLAQLYLSSAAQRRAVPCHALRCCTSPCWLCLLSNIQQYQVPCEVMRTRHRYVRMHSSFCFLPWVVLSWFSSCFFFTKLRQY